MGYDQIQSAVETLSKASTETPAQVAYKHVANLAANFLKTGDCAVFNEDALQYSELQAMFDAITS